MVRPQRGLNRPLLAAGAALAVLAVACAPAPEPVALALRGRVLDAPGTPLDGVRVRAQRRLDVRDLDTSRLSELDSVALACVDEQRPPECGDGVRTDRTDATGGFSLELRRSEVGPGPAVVGGPEAVDLVAVRPRRPGELSGPAVSRRLAPAGGDVPVADLVLWTPALELMSLEGGDALLRWSGDPPAAASQFRVLVETSEGGLVWSEASEGSELTLRLADLDGTLGAVSVIAVAESGAEFWRSPRVALRADQGAVALAGDGDVGWPFARSVSGTTMLVAIVALLLASSLLVAVGGVRHRRQLLFQGRRLGPHRH